MAEFTYNPVQLVAPGDPVIFNNSITCSRGYILHRNESGIVTLRGIVNNPCASFARYKVSFNGNIAVPEGSTVGPIAVALAIDGEALPTSRAIQTPAAAGDYSNVTCVATIDVPKGCCVSVSVEDVIATNDATATVIPVNVQNATLSVDRVA